MHVEGILMRMAGREDGHRLERRESPWSQLARGVQAFAIDACTRGAARNEGRGIGGNTGTLQGMFCYFEYH
ncbi:hypothetical protein ZHAS_00009834 [Anopheles sinensis]|uniref:Uncharacterized protein n=1 Tax=Anopheles sinensis TaxID=74873 RepID=A0A084VVZ3_ANOSI|nr:hypothetical protein ZHAS_00009834 [Anopheles sinensis]